jgi:hypothetical protein
MRRFLNRAGFNARMHTSPHAVRSKSESLFATVTRLLNQFRRDEWITIKDNSLTIAKPEQLELLTA